MSVRIIEMVSFQVNVLFLNSSEIKLIYLKVIYWPGYKLWIIFCFQKEDFKKKKLGILEKSILIVAES